MSNLVGIDRACFTKYFSGSSSPKMSTFLAICEELNVEPNYFFGNQTSNIKNEPKTKERELVEAFYTICEFDLVEKIDNSNAFGLSYDYALKVLVGEKLEEILKECSIYANSKFKNSIDMKKIIADKYEAELIKIKKGKEILRFLYE